MLERPGRQALKLWILLLPIYVGGMLANNRRLVWPEVAITALFFLFITPMGKFKRFLFRAMALSALPLIVYLAVGWNSEGGSLFAPVRTLRSLVDTERDTSTRWRDWENYNLVTTYKRRPLLGSGFGHPFEEVAKLPDVTSVYELEPYIPHNSVLGLWAFGGLIGFALIWVMYPVGMFFTVRAYRCARNPTERIAALGAAAAQICYLIQAYGDLGFGTWGPVFTLATSYAVVGKICVANGGWPMPRHQAGPSGATAAAGAPAQLTGQ
jgi:O-antigen ligase